MIWNKKNKGFIIYMVSLISLIIGMLVYKLREVENFLCILILLSWMFLMLIIWAKIDKLEEKNE